MAKQTDNKERAELLLEQAALSAREILGEASRKALEVISHASQTTGSAILAETKVINNEITHIKNDIIEIKEKFDKKYVSKDQFDPIKKIVYGLMTIILGTVGYGLMKLIFK